LLSKAAVVPALNADGEGGQQGNIEESAVGSYKLNLNINYTRGVQVKKCKSKKKSWAHTSIRYAPIQFNFKTK
jgi:hypothetical protein